MPAPYSTPFNGMVLITTSTGVAALSSLGYDISTYCRRARVGIQFDDNDVTTFGDNVHAHSPGLGDFTAEVELLQAFASTGLLNLNSSGATSPDKLLWDLANNKIRFNGHIRLTNAAVTSDNPGYSFNAQLLSHDPISGEIGTPLMTTLQMRGAGVLTRVTSS